MNIFVIIASITLKSLVTFYQVFSLRVPRYSFFPPHTGAETWYQGLSPTAPCNCPRMPGTPMTTSCNYLTCPNNRWDHNAIFRAPRSIAPGTGAISPGSKRITPSAGVIAPDGGAIAPDAGWIALGASAVVPNTGSITLASGAVAPYAGSAAPGARTVAPDAGSIARDGLLPLRYRQVAVFGALPVPFGKSMISTHPLPNKRRSPP